MLNQLRFFDIKKHCACVRENTVIKKPNISQKMRYSEYVRTSKTKQVTTQTVPVVIALQQVTTSY